MNDVHSPPSAPAPERTVGGLPVRHLVVATLVAAVVALAVGALIVLSIDDGPDVIGQGEGGGFELTPDDFDPEIVGAPVAVSYETFEGGVANTGSYVGRPLVLNFFAEWCPPCVAEMPDFESVYQETGDTVDFLGISYIESIELGRSVVELTGVTYDIGRDPNGDAYEVFGGIMMPTTVFIDAAGTVLEVHNGPLTADQLRARIDQHFGVTVS